MVVPVWYSNDVGRVKHSTILPLGWFSPLSSSLLVNSGLHMILMA